MVPRLAAIGESNMLIHMYITSGGTEKSPPLIGKCSSLSSEICVGRESGCLRRRKYKQIRGLGLRCAMQRLRGSERGGWARTLRRS